MSTGKDEPMSVFDKVMKGEVIGEDERASSRSSRKLGLGPLHLERGRAARAALEAASPDAGPGETILFELIGHQTAIALSVLEAQGELATRLEHFFDEPAKLVALSRALKELTGISNSVGRRVEGALTTASSLRAQRRLWNLGRS